MADAAMGYAPSNDILPGSYPLQTATIPTTEADGIHSVPLSASDLKAIVSEWISSMKEYLSAMRIQPTALFVQEAYWRDLLCMTWDFRTLQGRQQIADFVAASSPESRICNIFLDESTAYKAPQATQLGQTKTIQAFLNIETHFGRGQGLVRLVADPGDGGAWKAFTFFTCLQELKGHEESIHARRPTGLEAENKNMRWKDQLNAQHNYQGTREPTVYTPKDKLADWFTYYAGALELNVWMSTTLTSSEWDDSSRQWKVELTSWRDGVQEERTLRPKHIILATGHSGEPYLPSHITGIENFNGRLVHSSKFTEPSKNAKGKKAVVVGSCNSAHDIGKDYYEHGYDVTMIQRSSTLVLKSETLSLLTKGIYSEDGPPVDDADMIVMSLPNPVAKALQIGATTQLMQVDGELLRGLAAAGFKVDSGPDGGGFFMKYFGRGGGYYIDTGASQLIADRKIKVIHGQGVKAVQAHGLLLEDGSEVEADEIVFATGYQNMRESARKIFGREVAERVGDVWGFDEEGETRGMWRRSGHPGFWFFGGGLGLCRFYSRLLALQIKAIEIGLFKL
ncbi:MAG: hypothetical protein Q9216_002975 [Gyalolechia sp. 2 TL-2023]